ncbi:YggS family pyridoxal phosphate-dependent enzyme [candidate division CSSED10-310 bacterium]|uniref:Pyridoxal phosphate homeostasis protein n=1 Tax=candidate division CSSED10-310 bacterium TaxID=2855610 RepID=A0ABV6Z666_UNCC1
MNDLNLIGQNFKQIRQKIDLTARKVGRLADDIEIVVVTKTVDIEAMKIVIKAGAKHLGENKVQDAVKKQARLDEEVNWHFIGHLQTNKVKHVIGKFQLIHSVDSIRLAQKIEQEAEKRGIIQKILLEVNVSGETSKYGFVPADLMPACEQISSLKHVRLEGLMTMAPFTDDRAVIRSCFQSLASLRTTINGQSIAGIQMPTLSMGMTNDYLIAVEQGATLVRIGSAIFHG